MQLVCDIVLSRKGKEQYGQ